MEGEIYAVANRHIDRFAAAGEAEIMAQFAAPLPLTTILAMFGIPESDMDQCRIWSDESHLLTSSPLPPERQLACAQSFVAFQRYLGDLVEKRKKALGEDVVSCLLTVRPEGARPLSMAEVVITLLGVLLAGHETTTKLIGTALYLLLSQPERWQHLCEHPAAIPRIIEEVLRFDSPVHAFYRTALREAQVGDVTIPEGTRLLLAYGSANRDEAHFSHADQFDLDRSPNRHLAFGYGAHFCVGAPLARIEGRIALETLSQRLPHLRLQPHQTLSYIPDLMFRGFARLEVAWEF